MTIYYITDELSNSDEAISANALAEHINDTVAPFPTTTITQNVPTEIILLAHTNTGRTTIGDKSPILLADAFAKIIPTKERTKVTSITLISCEAGVGSPSLAQQLAIAMVKKGFHNIKIHAVGHPIGSLIGGGVEVTMKAGTVSGGTVGQVNGYFYGNEESQAYHSYLQLKGVAVTDRTTTEKATLRQLDKKYKNFDKEQIKEQIIIINLVTDIDDLREPYNTFTENGPEKHISAEVAIALSFFKKQKTVLQRLYGLGDVIESLDAIMTELKKNPELTRAEMTKKLQHNVNRLKKTNKRWLSNHIAVYLTDYLLKLDAELNRMSEQLIIETQISSDNLSDHTPLLEKTLPEKLIEYATAREQEWGFHWDFLYLKTFAYYVIDGISTMAKSLGLVENSTDYFDSKYRDTKVNAAKKLANIVRLTEVSVFTLPEKHALSEGRLGAIVNSAGGLDKILEDAKNRLDASKEREPSAAVNQKPSGLRRLLHF